MTVRFYLLLSILFAMLKYLLLVPVFSVFCGANGEDQEFNLSCEQDWSPVGTNCLLFQEEALNHPAAKAFCEEQDSKHLNKWSSSLNGSKVLTIQ